MPRDRRIDAIRNHIMDRTLWRNVGYLKVSTENDAVVRELQSGA